MEINLFADVFVLLEKKITVFVFVDRGVKIVYNFLMLKFSMLIVPAAVFIEPEYGLIFWDDDFGSLFVHLCYSTITTDLDNSFLCQIMKIMSTTRWDEKGGKISAFPYKLKGAIDENIAFYVIYNRGDSFTLRS